MAVILLVSEGALSPEFGFFLLAYGLVALAFLATAHPVSEAQDRRLLMPGNAMGLSAAVLGVVMLTLVASIGVFLTMPQLQRIRLASPLPSRLDLTIGRPVSPTDLETGETAPMAGFLPTRPEAGPAGGGGGAAGAAATTAREGQPAGPGLDAGDGSGTVLAVEGAEYVTLGYVGEQERDLVMYVRSPLASYWRGQVLDKYDGRGWIAADDESQLEVDRWGRLRFRDASRRTLSSDRYVQSFFPRVAQPNAIFTGYSPGYVAVQDPALGRDRTKVARENARRLHQGSDYRVVSAVPALTPESLVRVSTDQDYMEDLPTLDVPRRVRDLAHLIVAGSTSDFQKAARIEQYLLLNYEYDLRVDPLSRSADVVDTFLFERRAGYCAQFATTMAAMARVVGLPARVATGYVPGRYNSLTGAHAVRLQDAHAWVEIKFDRYGWVPFDPTPRPDSPWSLDRGFSVATQTLQGLIRTELKDLALGGVSSAAGAAATLVFNLGPVVVAVLVTVLVIALSAAVAAAFRRRQRSALRTREGYTLLSGVDREAVRKAYVKALRLLACKGYPSRRAHESPEDYLTTLASLGLHVPQSLRELSRHAALALYDPAPLAPDAAKKGTESLGTLRGLPRLS